MKLSFVSAPGVLLAISLTVAACGSSDGSHATASAAASAAPSAAPAVSSVAPASTPGQGALAAARNVWKHAAQAPLAMVNTYYMQAASDLRKADDPSYRTAISELTYLANLPDSNDTSAQQATAETDQTALDSFFGTPGQ